MSFTIRKAERKQAKLRRGIAGPSGAWKTYSALLLARGLATDWSKVAVIDTENGSGELYSDLGPYNALTMTEFKPSDYVQAIKACEDAGMEVVIIDSITHEWKYILDAVEKITQASNAKNSYTAWAKATPQHDTFIQAMLRSKCHVVATVRSKQDYDMGKDSNGKTVVRKVGMKQETREGFEYELTLSLDVDQFHNATASKDRTGLFSDWTPFTISTDTGKKLKEWNESGAHSEEIISESEQDGQAS